MQRNNEKDFKDFEDVPLSRSSVTLRLADIQRRCTQLIVEDDDIGGLTLVDPAPAKDNSNPYDRG